MTNINTFKTVAEVEAYRNEINEACNKRAAFINLCEKANSYSEKSFGFIKEAFEAIAPLLFNTSEGKGIIRKYTNTVRKSGNLTSLHSLYENLRKGGKDMDSDFFVNSIANEDWNVDSSTIKEDCANLGRILAEGILSVGEEAVGLMPVGNSSLDAAVKFISENKKTNKNIAEYSNAVKIIRESVENNEGSCTIAEAVNLDGMAEKLLSEFNAKYSESLNEEEVVALKEICGSVDRESVFNKYKSACAEKISEAKKSFESKGDLASSTKLQTVLEQVSKKEYSLDTVGSDICSLIELSNIFE